MGQHAPAANPNQPHKQHPAGHVTPGGRLARSSRRLPLILHCFFTSTWVSKSGLRAETLGWSLIADAVWRRGSGASKHAQTFVSRRLRLRPGFQMASLEMHWNRCSVAARRVLSGSTGIEEQLKPLFLELVKAQTLPSSPTSPVPPSRLELQPASPIIFFFYKIGFKKPPLLLHGIAKAMLRSRGGGGAWLGAALAPLCPKVAVLPALCLQSGRKKNLSCGSGDRVLPVTPASGHRALLRVRVTTLIVCHSVK